MTVHRFHERERHDLPFRERLRHAHKATMRTLTLVAALAAAAPLLYLLIAVLHAQP